MSKNINWRAKVAEINNFIPLVSINSTNSNSIGRRPRARLLSVDAIVASSHNRDNARVEKSLDGAIDGLREGAAERHVHNGLALDSPCVDVVDNPLHALNDARVGAGAVFAEDLYINDVGRFGDAKGCACDGA